MENKELQEVKRIPELKETEKKALVLDALLKAGFSQYQAAQLMNVSKQHVSQVNKKLKKGTLQPLVKQAKKAVEAILEGKTIGTVQSVKASDVLTAAKMVLDRSDPVTVKTESTHVSVNYDLGNEDREKYKKALGIIDAEYEVLPTEPPALPEPTAEVENE